MPGRRRRTKYAEWEAVATRDSPDQMRDGGRIVHSARNMAVSMSPSELSPGRLSHRSYQKSDPSEAMTG